MANERPDTQDSLSFSEENKAQILAEVATAVDQLNSEAYLRQHVQERTEEYVGYLEDPDQFGPGEYFSVNQLVRPSFPNFLDVIPSVLWKTLSERAREIILEEVGTYFKVNLVRENTQFAQGTEPQVIFSTNNPLIEFHLVRLEDGTVDHRMVRTNIPTEQSSPNTE